MKFDRIINSLKFVRNLIPLVSFSNVSVCRSRGREFDPGPVPYFRGD